MAHPSLQPASHSIHQSQPAPFCHARAPGLLAHTLICPLLAPAGPASPTGSSSSCARTTGSLHASVPSACLRPQALPAPPHLQPLRPPAGLASQHLTHCSLALLRLTTSGAKKAATSLYLESGIILGISYEV